MGRDPDKINIQAEILEALSKVEDQNLKAVLLIMHKGFGQVSEAVWALRNDIPGLREAVLNGHAAVHHEDHDWIAERRHEDEEASKEGKATSREIRDWARTRISDETDNRASRRVIRDGLITDAIKVLGGVLLTLFALGAASWLHDMPRPYQIREHVTAPKDIN